MDLPTQESQPPLCTIVSGYTGAERCLFHCSLGSRRMERRIPTNSSELSLQDSGSSTISLSQVKVLAGSVTNL